MPKIKQRIVSGFLIAFASITLVGGLTQTRGGSLSTLLDDVACPALEFIRRNAGDTAWECAAGAVGGDALTSSTIAQFASITSLALLGEITDETGTGAAVFGTGPTLSTVELGHATDTTIARSAAGVLTVEGVTLPRLIASSTIALNTTTVTTATCGTAQTSTATGAAATDVIVWTFNADVSAVTGYTPATTGGLSLLVYPTTNTVNVKVCNPTTSDITPSATVTLNWKVLR